jgi:D-alanine-D-alanine ligase
MSRLRIAVLFGGRSGEHEVSLVSAASVMHALDPARYDILPVGISKDGAWICGADALARLRDGATEGTTIADVRRCILAPDPTLGLLSDDGAGGWRREHVDVLFPVLHGPFGEDGTVQGLFELSGIPYVGAGVLGSAVGMDKIVQKELFQAAGLPVVPYIWAYAEECRTSTDAVCDRAEASLSYPMFVKPPNMGSSVGISKARARSELAAALVHAAAYDRTVLVEQAVSAPREIEVAVLGAREAIASAPGEIIPSNEFYDYAAKYVDGASATIVPAELDASLAERLRGEALRAFAAVRCEGMARVDFLVARESGETYLNEVNTIPGFTSISMYPKLFAYSGVPYPELLDRLIALALARSEEVRALRRSYDEGGGWHRDESR